MKIGAFYIKLQIQVNFLIRKVSSNCSFFCNLIIFPKVFKIRRSSYPEGQHIHEYIWYVHEKRDDLVVAILKHFPIFVDVKRKNMTEQACASSAVWEPSNPPECIIHCSNDTQKLISPQDLVSWKNLLRAAEIRKHAPLLEIAKTCDEGQIPKVYYHRRCRSIFTMKKQLDAIVLKEVERGDTVPSQSSESR